MTLKKLIKPDFEWKKILDPLQYHILREGGTEQAFKGEFFNNKAKGTYSCIACDNLLFSYKSKYDSGTGWPSFFAPISKESLLIKPTLQGIDGSEVLCAKCEGHHGHVFLDGPKPTGLRFCMNSIVLKFNKDD
jgi:peptide-methionine (R)-S-oxide reductase